MPLSKPNFCDTLHIYIFSEDITTVVIKKIVICTLKYTEIIPCYSKEGKKAVLYSYVYITVATVFGQDGEPVANLIHAWSLVTYFGHRMKLVTHNTQEDLALRGSFLQPREVVGLENASANLQVNLDNITGLQETAVMSISPEGPVRSRGHYFYLMVNVAAIRTFHITIQTQDYATKLVRQHFPYYII